jgi:hypothetical protein
MHTKDAPGAEYKFRIHWRFPGAYKELFLRNNQSLFEAPRRALVSFL